LHRPRGGSPWVCHPLSIRRSTVWPLNETEINVLGNNISNAGTTGFKQSNGRFFSTQLANTLSSGSAPSSTTGGQTPARSAWGARSPPLPKIFSQGSITSSSSRQTSPSRGTAFSFSNSASAGGQVYTRDGNFSLDSANELTNNAGQQVLGTASTPTSTSSYGTDPAQDPPWDRCTCPADRKIQWRVPSSQGVTATQGTLLTGAAMTDTSRTAALPPARSVKSALTSPH